MSQPCVTCTQYTWVLKYAACQFIIYGPLTNLISVTEHGLAQCLLACLILMEVLNLFTGETSYRPLHCTVTDQYTSAPAEHYSLQHFACTQCCNKEDIIQNDTVKAMNNYSKKMQCAIILTAVTPSDTASNIHRLSPCPPFSRKTRLVLSHADQGLL